MRKRRRIPLIALFAAGVMLVMYPGLSNAWNTRYQRQVMVSYEEAAAESGYDALACEWEKARAYNDSLWPSPEPEDFAFLSDDDPDPEYMDCLNLNGDGVMGWVEIPCIDVKLQIYHTTEGEGMERGAGHLEGTSLPVGGESTHCVIAAHRGLPGARLFTELDRVEEGSRFYLHVLGETLAYEVDQIKTVSPDDTSGLRIESGEDCCTLLTCTPYGVNTERLLVRGHRVPYEEGMEEDDAGSPALHMDEWLLIAGALIAASGTAAFIRAYAKNRKQ